MGKSSTHFYTYIHPLSARDSFPIFDLVSPLDALHAYAAPAMLGAKLDEFPGSRSVAGLRARYERTLADRPWKQCPCAICQSLSIEVVIFLASNRNKRRGIHTLGIYKALLNSLPASS